MALLWCILLVPCLVLAQNLPENPCPNIFTYKQQRGIYYGEITLPYDGSKTLNMAVNISMVGLYQDVKVKLDLLTPAEAILSTPVLRYRVNFPFRNVIPKITQITYNNKIYCYGPGEPVTTNGVTNLWANILYQINEFSYNVDSGAVNPPSKTNPFLTNINNFNNIDQTSAQTPTKITIKDSCGIANDIQTLVLKGSKTRENEYPWLVAMFHKKQFQCTANLISNRYTITAAHCLRYYNAPLVDQEDILLVLGHSDLTNWASTGAIIRTAQEIIPHPNYKQYSGHCDVAIIKMNEDVIFKISIRPICLWDADSNIKTITGSQGIVAGWGKTEDSKNVAVPRKVSMPVVSQEACLRSHDDFQKLTSEMTFCAGNRNGSGPCSGDSGAGFIVKKGDRWYLRGIVSTAVQNSDLSCNLEEYIVFADVAKFKEWVVEAMK